MDGFFNKDGIAVIADIVLAIQQNKEMLSRIDGAIGDGDHGINMNKGFTIASKRIDGSHNLSSGFGVVANVLLTEIGGSMGPIYGTFFEVLSNKSEPHDIINKNIFGHMLESATDSVIEICGAQPGDKTLIDALVPAIHNFGGVINKNGTFEAALQAMVKGAEEGRDSTINLIARKGRSSRLGERSKGVVDAGAASCYLILEAMAKSISKILRTS